MSAIRTVGRCLWVLMLGAGCGSAGSHPGSEVDAGDGGGGVDSSDGGTPAVGGSSGTIGGSGGAEPDPGPCASGTWDHDDDVQTDCVTWTKCAPGQFVATEGSASEDQTCSGCESGSFSTIANAAECSEWRCVHGVQLQRDKYVGYVPLDALSREILAPTHRVRALGTFIYALPDIKSPPLMHLSLNAELSVADRDERFCALEGGGYVVSRHVIEIGRHAQDFVEIAERLIGTPYLWGGRTRLGLDCSGLVQIALEAAGIAAPRDTDMQQAELGRDVPVADVAEGLRRGDLVFWKGHVGIMADSMTLVHANAHHMAVTAETFCPRRWSASSSSARK